MHVTPRKVTPPRVLARLSAPTQSLHALFTPFSAPRPACPLGDCAHRQGASSPTMAAFGGTRRNATGILIFALASRVKLSEVPNMAVRRPLVVGGWRCVIASLGCACSVLQRWAVDCPSCCKGQLQPDGTDGTVVGGVHRGRCSSAWSWAPDGVRGILHGNTPARQQKPPHGSGARQARSRCQPRATRGASTRRAAAPLAGAGHATEILEDCRPMRSRLETGVAGRAEPTTGWERP